MIGTPKFTLTTWIVELKGIGKLKVKVFSKMKPVANNNEFNEVQFSIMMNEMPVTEAYP